MKRKMFKNMYTSKSINKIIVLKNPYISKMLVKITA